MTKTKLVPMNQICLLNDCKKLAKFEREGMYYCAKCYDSMMISEAQKPIIFEQSITRVLEDAIAQINYLRSKLSAGEINNTWHTTQETINKINELIKLIKEKK